MTERFTRHETYEDYAITIRAHRAEADAAWELRVDIANPEGVRCMPAQRIANVEGASREDVAEVGLEQARILVYEFQKYGLEHQSRPPAED
ncbi:hypothetical protein [Coralloluteibacterium stylophorae]|uniref:Uncharacterized protein n=1 Tax=Coralloluteibacterium stylophorae TaxID=1776034 RepID=A0A8J7VTU5_9GAMM|nr:hypothetical protein [Coralloluteibacterium stylophorae]MBS7458193.1 hypothetical protein [Coralloluteibacterium stylophorae]